MRVGGNFPYASKADEFNLYVEVHLRNNNPDNTPQNVQDPEQKQELLQ